MPLGVPPESCTLPLPRVIGALRGTRVVAISAGETHSMVLTDKGTVKSFGHAGDYGLLGHANTDFQLRPKVIASLRGIRVVAISAGDSNSLVLADEGSVISFGLQRVCPASRPHQPAWRPWRVSW